MKWSRYNFFEDDGEGKVILFNAAAKTGMALAPELASVIRSHTSDVEPLSSIHPALFGDLLKGGMIVEDSADEFEAIVSGIISDERNPKVFEVIVNPTMDCNLRCWYCYEKHLSGSMMSEKVLDAVGRLIRRKLGESNLRHFTLSFFGGEPLMAFTQCVKPLVEVLRDAIRTTGGKTADIGFTTNAVLLTREVADFLAESGFSVSCQVPFDGGSAMHDKIKSDSYGRGTYKIILDNIDYALGKGVTFTIRCNYTAENIASFDELVDDVEALARKYEGLLRISLQRVWQQKETPGLLNALDALERKISDKKIASLDGRNSHGCRCYGDSANSVVVNYDGNVFKCTARKFTSSAREGVLNDDGTIAYNETYFHRMNLRFSNPICKECRIFPICEVCTQRRMEGGVLEHGGCIRTYTESDMEDAVRSSIKRIFGS